MSINYNKIEFVNGNQIVELDEYDLIELAKLALNLSPCVGVDEYSGRIEALREYFSVNKNDRLYYPYKIVFASSKALELLKCCVEVCDFVKCYSKPNVTVEEDAMYNVKSEKYDELVRLNSVYMNEYKRKTNKR